MIKDLLRTLFDAAVARAQAEHCVPPYLPPPPEGRTIVVGAGKAAASMAQAVERHWPGPLSGLVVTRYGHGAPCRRIEVIEAAHPVPDASGAAAAASILALVAEAGPDDLVLCLISGGGSALLSLPAPGLTLADKQAVNKALLTSGATISEMNCLRKHLSAVKGGRLGAAAHPARLVTLAISDVPGDDPAVIASGPTVADPTTFADARAILERYAIDEPSAVTHHLRAAADETPKPGDRRLAATETTLVATPGQALVAAAGVARAAGYAPVIVGDAIEGEAREVAAEQARRALGTPPGHVLLSGGETTVTVRGEGRGGRNCEYLLALALALDGHPGIWALACDTDGIDGTEDNAGALLSPDTVARAAAMGLDAEAYLADNDCYGFFSALGDLVVTGPTFTNVNDFRAVLVENR
ncbi:MAG: glycerate kinase [Rhodospirillales bacterium]|jgi:hydroxypyruvate reductase|nr:glycerate kinase [Rhodospirillales bacterium]MDP6883577.1 glycerate kinase [Rhodospirillales bacterium]